MRTSIVLFAAAAFIVGCSERDTANIGNAASNLAQADVEEVPVDEGSADGTVAGTVVTDAWAGKWVGPEGLALEIAKTDAPGTYDLSVTLLDGTERYVGTGEGDTIRFTRGGVEEVIRAATGDETGLKYLAGKQDCLMIKPAEGFCRG